jgi:hypothetical protein
MVVKGGTDFYGNGKASILLTNKEKGRLTPLSFRNFYSVPYLLAVAS